MRACKVNQHSGLVEQALIDTHSKHFDQAALTMAEALTWVLFW